MSPGAAYRNLHEYAYRGLHGPNLRQDRCLSMLLFEQQGENYSGFTMMDASSRQPGAHSNQGIAQGFPRNPAVAPVNPGTLGGARQPGLPGRLKPALSRQTFRGVQAVPQHLPPTSHHLLPRRPGKKLSPSLTSACLLSTFCCTMQLQHNTCRFYCGKLAGSTSGILLGHRHIFLA